MRDLFIAGTKILGIWGIYRSLLFIPSIIDYLVRIQAPLEQHPAYDPARFLMHLIISFFLYLLSGLLLTFGTETLANLLRVKDRDTQKISSPNIELFRIGVNLLGIYMLANSIPLIMSTIYQMDGFLYGTPQGVSDVADLIVYGLQTVFGLALVFAGSRVANYISQKNRSFEKAVDSSA